MERAGKFYLRNGTCRCISHFPRTGTSNVEKCTVQDLVPSTVYGDDTRRKTLIQETGWSEKSCIEQKEGKRCLHQKIKQIKNYATGTPWKQ